MRVAPESSTSVADIVAIPDLVTIIVVTTSLQVEPVSYTHLRAHETVLDLVCRLLLEKKKKTKSSLVDIINQTQLRKITAASQDSRPYKLYG